MMNETYKEYRERRNNRALNIGRSLYIIMALLLYIGGAFYYVSRGEYLNILFTTILVVPFIWMMRLR